MSALANKICKHARVGALLAHTIGMIVKWGIPTTKPGVIILVGFEAEQSQVGLSALQ